MYTRPFAPAGRATGPTSGCVVAISPRLAPRLQRALITVALEAPTLSAAVATLPVERQRDPAGLPLGLRADGVLIYNAWALTRRALPLSAVRLLALRVADHLLARSAQSLLPVRAGARNAVEDSPASGTVTPDAAWVRAITRDAEQLRRRLAGGEPATHPSARC